MVFTHHDCALDRMSYGVVVVFVSAKSTSAAVSSARYTLWNGFMVCWLLLTQTNKALYVPATLPLVL